MHTQRVSDFSETFQKRIALSRFRGRGRSQRSTQRKALRFSFAAAVICFFPSIPVLICPSLSTTDLTPMFVAVHQNIFRFFCGGGRRKPSSLRNIPNEPSSLKGRDQNERVAARIAQRTGPTTDSRQELPNGRDQWPTRDVNEPMDGTNERVMARMNHWPGPMTESRHE